MSMTKNARSSATSSLRQLIVELNAVDDLDLLTLEHDVLSA